MDYLAFDFGDGTTCAAHYDDSFAESGIKPQKLSIVKGSDEIWSVIGFDSRGENPYIGEAASRPGYKILSNWKSKPSQYTSSGPDAWKRQAAVDFMRIVFDNFLSNNPEYTREGVRNGNPYTVVIGVPCDWDYDDIEEYQKIANEAGIPNVQVVKESQAAMFFARRFMRGGIPDEDIRNGVLLVDVGSSTTDFTYMRGADQVGHCGLALGAQAVEGAFLVETMKRASFRYWANNQTSGVRVLARDPDDAKRMQVRDAMRARKYKEAYFRGVDQSADHFQETEALPIARESIGEISEGVGYLTHDYIDHCLDDEGNSPCKFKLSQLSEEWDGAGLDMLNTWRGHFRSALRHVKEKWSVGSSVSIVVTGGASRMQFVEKDIVDVLHPSKMPYFGDDGARSYSVVMGLAWCGFARDRIKRARQDIKHMLESSQISNIVDKFVGHLLEKPAAEIAEVTRNKLENELSTHSCLVNTMRKLKNQYSEIVCEEWNKLIQKFNSGIAIKSILDDSVLVDMTATLYKEFGRPNVTLATDVRAFFEYTLISSDMPFHPFNHSVFNPDEDDDFDGEWGWGMKWEAPLENVRKEITPFSITQKFRNQLHNVTTNEIMPSFWAQICNAIVTRVREFKMSELDALAGTLEYR